MIDKKHYLPKKKDRANKWFHPIYKYNSKSQQEYNRIEDLLDEITVDVVNGLAKSDIFLKMESGLYENMKKGVKHDTALDYYRAVMSRLQIDEPDRDNAKNIFYSMYLNLYREQMEVGNTIGAKATLDSMVRLMGLDKPTNAILINSDKEGGITVNFGFSDNKISDS